MIDMQPENIDLQEGIEISVRISDKVYRFNLEQELFVNEDDIDHLSEEMIKQPSKYARFAALAVEAAHLVANEKLSLLELKNQISADIEQLLRSKGLKVTKKLVEHEVSVDSRILLAERNLLATERTKRHLDVALKAFEQRKSMLQSYGAIKRSELFNSGDVSTTDKGSSFGARQREQEQAVREQEQAVKENQKTFAHFRDRSSHSSYNSAPTALGGKNKRQ